MYLNFKWRASLVPAAAVIPAPLAYTIIVAVKRLVVGLNNLVNDILRLRKYHHTLNTRQVCLILRLISYLKRQRGILTHFNTVNKSECIKHVVFECALNVLSWDVALLIYCDRLAKS